MNEKFNENLRKARQEASALFLMVDAVVSVRIRPDMVSYYSQTYR